MAEDSLRVHIVYLEAEVKNLDRRAGELEATIVGFESEQKKHAVLELINRLRNEASEHRKYLALVKQK